MTHQTRTGIGLVRLGDSDFVPANSEDELRGKDAYDAEGQRIGSVEDLYIDRKVRKVRFLEMSAGGFLGIGEKQYLVPVEAVTQVTEDRVTIEPERTQKVEVPARRRPARRRLRLAAVRRHRPHRRPPRLGMLRPLWPLRTLL